MKFMRCLVPLLLTPLFILGGCSWSPSNSDTSSAKSQSSTSEVQGESMKNLELLVAFVSEEAAQGRAALFEKHGVKEVEKVGSTPLYLVRVPTEADLEKIKKTLAAEEAIRYAEPNLQIHIYTSKPKPQK